jgi:hypothetical protein
MAATSHSCATPAEAQPIANQDHSTGFSEWFARALDEGVKPEQALAFIGLGLMQRMGRSADAGDSSFWSEAQAERIDLTGLRQRLELIDLAIRTAAPLSTAEVGALLGARPGTPQVERGGVVARRVSRNVWKLARSGADGNNGYGDAFRRRL